MRPILTADEMRRADASAIASGVPSLLLMEHAAKGALDAVLRVRGSVRGVRILVLCGKGNNGGDGLAFARLARQRGGRPTVAILGESKEISGDALTNLRRVRKLRIPVVDNAGASVLGAEKWEIVVDAMLGTGASLPLREPMRSVIAAANALPAFRCALDLPTGVTADGTVDFGTAFSADLTVTFGAIKPGVLFGQGRLHAGRVEIVDIFLPEAPLLAEQYSTRLVASDDVRVRMPQRLPDDNKYTRGKVFLLCGSAGMMGAAVLASRAAMRTGAGITVLGVPRTLATVAACKLTETMIARIADSGEGYLSDPDARTIAPHLAWADAIVLGCGLSRNPDTAVAVRAAVARATRPIVLDADGIGAFAGHLDALRDSPAPLILTPHAGELSRLTGMHRDDIMADRLAAARDAARDLRAIVLLKGGPTVVATPAGIAYVNPTGNPGMATAGAGDVLAGMIGGLLAQGLAPIDAAVCGAFIHGRAGDFAAEHTTELALTAGDVLDRIPQAVRELGIPSTAQRFALPQ